MKRLLNTLTIFLLALPTFAIDQVFMEPFDPVTPEVTAQGRAFTAVAEGYNALFTNPAGFSRSPVSITPLSVQAGVELPPSQAGRVLGDLNNVQSFNITKGLADPTVSLVNDILTNYGAGANFSAGMGWVGGNLGIGLAVQARTFVKGQNVVNAQGTMDVTEGLVLGYSVPIDLSWAKLHVGLDARPMQRTYSDNVYAVDIYGAKSDLQNVSVYNGFGLGWDWGSILDFGLTPSGYWSAGMVLRDIGSTAFSFHQTTVGDSIKAVGFPSSSGAAPTSTYRIPMVIAFGGSWAPDMGWRKSIVDPRVEMDVQAPLMDTYTQTSVWTWFHVGAQAKLLNFLTLRTGLNQGYFTFGFGLQVFAVDLNASIYSDELGRYSGALPRSSIDVQTDVRF